MILEYNMIDEKTGATLGGVTLDGESADTMAALFESVSGEKVREGTRIPGVAVTRVALRAIVARKLQRIMLNTERSRQHDS